MKTKLSLLISLCMILILPLCSCCLWYDAETEGNITYGYSDVSKDAFVGSYFYEGDYNNIIIELPNYYKDYPITSLGGYTGRGFPHTFAVEFDAEKLNPNGTIKYSTVMTDNELSEASTVNFDITLYIGSNLKKIERAYTHLVYIFSENTGGEAQEVVYVPIYYIICEEDNETFYSKNGRLYYKETDKLVEVFYYAE